VGQHRYPQLADPAWLRRRYVDAGWAISAIAGEVGCSKPAARRALAAAGIPRRPHGGPRQHARLTDHAWLRRRYVDGLASTSTIASEVGCSEHSVRRALAAAGIPREGRSRARRGYRQLADAE
jgi:hypothetical protein